MSDMRLQKFLSSAGVCSRRKGEALIVAGRVAVNGKITAQLGTKIDPNQDHVEVDGKAIQPSHNLIYIALNKPQDYVTSCRHPGEKVVVELVDIRERVYPVQYPQRNKRCSLSGRRQWAHNRSWRWRRPDLCQLRYRCPGIRADTGRCVLREGGKIAIE